MAKGPVTSRITQAEPRVRRGYFESRFGQLHLHNAIPPGGGFDEATALICLHGTPASGRTFRKLLTLVGRDRSVYAPDLPGYGESDPPPSRPTIADYAAAIADFCDTMRFRQVDVLGHQSGAFVAAELAIVRPTVIRRVVLASIPLPTDADREAFRRAPWPVPPVEDGIGGQPAPKHECFKEPAGMAEMPLGRADLGHRLHHEVLSSQRFTEKLGGATKPAKCISQSIPRDGASAWVGR